jgi:hypothetical protein
VPTTWTWTRRTTPSGLTSRSALIDITSMSSSSGRAVRSVASIRPASMTGELIPENATISRIGSYQTNILHSISYMFGKIRSITSAGRYGNHYVSSVSYSVLRDKTALRRTGLRVSVTSVVDTRVYTSSVGTAAVGSVWTITAYVRPRERI